MLIIVETNFDTFLGLKLELKTFSYRKTATGLFKDCNMLEYLKQTKSPFFTREKPAL